MRILAGHVKELGLEGNHLLPLMPGMEEGLMQGEEVS